jgi:hypothetical protein
MAVKKLWLTLSLLACTTLSHGTPKYYKVHPQKMRQDLYKDLLSGAHIETGSCSVYTEGRRGLKYDPKRLAENKLFFERRRAAW